MPIALLLPSMLAPLSALAAAFERWNAVLRVEALVIDRARGAFLVDWFGTRLPRNGHRLRVVIDNIEALGERYREVRARSMGGQTGPSLLEPVAGMAGMAVGMFLSPSGAMMYLYAQLRTSLCLFGSILLTITHGPLMTEIFTGLGGGLAVALLPFAFIAGIVVTITAAAGDGTWVMANEVLGDATRMIQALTRFINLLTGPREAIRNPLLRGILQLFDRVAALLAQLIGAFAWAITRIGPLILPTAIEFRAMQQLGEFAIGLARDLLRGTFDALVGVLRSESGRRASPWSVLLAMFAHVMTVTRRLVEGAGEALTQMSQLLREGFGAISTGTRSHIALVAERARAAIEDIPQIRMFRAAVAMATAVRTIVGSGGSPTPPPSGGSAIARALAPAALTTSLLPPPPVPSLASAQAMIDSARAGGKRVDTPWGKGLSTAATAPFELDAATRARAQDLMASPTSVFAGERRAIRDELGGATPAAALAAMRARELRYRGLLYGIVGQVLPPQVRAYLPELMGAFNAIDRTLYERGTPSGTPDFPVRDLPDNGRLRPVVRRLTVRQAGGDNASLRGIANDLTRLLREQVYLAPATG